MNSTRIEVATAIVASLLQNSTDTATHPLDKSALIKKAFAIADKIIAYDKENAAQ
jgi:hypothetical protein